MAPTRPSTPPPSRSSPRKFGHPPVVPAPSTPVSRRNGFNGGSNVILGSEHATVPPSPGLPVPGFAALTMSPVPAQVLPIRQSKRKRGGHARTDAGVKKKTKKKPSGTMAKLVDVGFKEKVGTSDPALQKPFRFMDLPGELRNQIYMHTHGRPKQALLVYRPRLASLRPRTRLDRGRTLASDIVDQDQEKKISGGNNRSRLSTKPKPKTEPRETNRPFWGLTQVCRQLRAEYRPIYMAKQEIGMDLTEIVDYLKTFYPIATDVVSNLGPPGERSEDAPFVGNLTIAVGDKPNELERAGDGIEVFTLLDIWANSLKIEAGFGRYLKANYVAETDGEAKDLRSLASVRIHRKPAQRDTAPVPAAPAMVALAATLGVVIPATPAVTKPYLHIIFKKESAEPWMTQFESVVPTGWLSKHGFGGMEHFEVKVGVDKDDSN
ncbi:hypothetical protein J4E80_003107 [Alternaria sp. BMP 0032]|nr:hypothetical protein J4E80_003107 [Alternaria sp. BMP 0032]